MINVCDLVTADVRYFDREHNGMEYTPAISKVILLNRGGYIYKFVKSW